MKLKVRNDFAVFDTRSNMFFFSFTDLLQYCFFHARVKNDSTIRECRRKTEESFVTVSDSFYEFVAMNGTFCLPIVRLPN